MIPRRTFLASALGLLPIAAASRFFRASPQAQPEQLPGDKLVTTPTKAPTRNHSAAAHRSISDFGAVGDGVTDNTHAIQQAINQIPDGATLYIPEGRFRFTSQIICNKSISWQGEGPASCLWAEQPLWPAPAWTDGAMLQFGYPYGGHPGQPPRGVAGVRIADFSVSGASDVNPAFALGFFHVMHSRIDGILCNANAGRGGTAFAGLNGTVAEIRCDFGGGLANTSSEKSYLEAHPIDVGQPYTKGGYTLVDLRFRGLRAPLNGFARKRYEITGAGATNAFRVFGNTGETVTIILGLAGATWPNGRASTSSTVRVYDASSTRGGAEAQVIILDLGADVAPFRGRPANYSHSTDPMNANTFNFVLRGNGGGSGAGLLVERQDAGGNNTFTGLYEGFVDTGERYKKEFGISKYCMKISGAQGFSIQDAHFESAGSGPAGGYKDPCLIIGDRQTATKYFSLGPRLSCDQKILIAGNATYFSLLGVKTSFLEMPRSLSEGKHWDRNAATEIVNPIIRS
jgi:hypothetical protein